MKFSLQLEEYQVLAWKQYYFPYKALKKWLEELAAASGSGPASSLPSSLPSQSASPPGSPKPTPTRGLARRRSTVEAIIGEEIDEQNTVEETWHMAVERAAVRSGQFVCECNDGIHNQLRELSRMGNEMVADGRAGCDEHLEFRFLDALGKVKEVAAQLRGFAEINHAALFKIMKKHDKLLKSSQGITVRLPRLLELSTLSEADRFDAIDAEVRRVSSLMPHCDGLNASLDVARLAAGLSTSRQAGTLTAREAKADQVLFFFIGCCVSLSLAIVVLIALPPSNPDTFYMPYFLAPFPVFQVVLYIVLTLWGCGFVVRQCDSSGINHMFLLGIDPRCRVGPRYFFSRAAALTSCWIVIFGGYVVDYKWQVLPTSLSGRGYNSRSSWHYVLYSAILVIIAAIVVCPPASDCLFKYQVAFLKSLGRTSLAPFFVVSFADNVVGDALTSLAKPLQVIPGAICYFLSSHPQTHYDVHRFDKQGDVCPTWEHFWLKPFIAALPFVFRAFQCLRRYRDLREIKHVVNFGKYVASLMVVIIAHFWKASYLTIVISAVATVYAATWDISMDWGLTRQDVLPAIFGSRPRSDTRELSQPAAQELITESRASMHTLNGESVHRRSLGTDDRHFETKTYLLAAFVDIVARFTWLQTLMPGDVLSSSIVAREAAVVTSAAVEIFRRSFWAVLRIEYEQVSNASGFRTLLWVPSKMHTSTAAASTAARLNAMELNTCPPDAAECCGTTRDRAGSVPDHSTFGSSVSENESSVDESTIVGANSWQSGQPQSLREPRSSNEGMSAIVE